MSIFSTLALPTFALLSLALCGGCGGDSCLRNSDCSNGFVCQVGVCVVYVPPPDGDVTDDAATDAGDAHSEVETIDANEGGSDSDSDSNSN